ncbi:MAG: hypothetical protein JHC33_12115 [Ignisphaera sp.]|nr:hypothetical protein [Ignisphaera sp.]
MSFEDWKTRKKEEEIAKTVSDEVHEFLTKVFNVYIIKFESNLFRYLESVRDKLIPLTVRFDNSKYSEFCDNFSRIYRTIMLDKQVSENSKKLLMELAQETNKFFSSKGFSTCVKELKYYKVRVKAMFRDAPLQGAKVTIETEGRVVASSETDNNGYCELEVPEGKFTVYIYKELKEEGEGEYIYEERSINVPQDLEVVFNIKTTKTRGEVEKEREKQPRIKELS